jgi:hypothetical protein
VPGELSLFLSGEHACRCARRVDETVEELASVFRLPSRRGHQHLDRRAAQLARTPYPQRRRERRLLELLLRKPACSLDLFTQAELYAFLADRDEALAVPCGNEETHRVRADIDDSNLHAGDSGQRTGRQTSCLQTFEHGGQRVRPCAARRRARALALRMNTC